VLLGPDYEPFRVSSTCGGPDVFGDFRPDICFIANVVYLGGIIWSTEGGTQGTSVIMGRAIVINKAVNPYQVRNHK